MKVATLTSILRRGNPISDSSPDSPAIDKGSAIDPFKLVARIKQRGPAPVHLWDPPFCGEMDMLIARDGTWIHEGKPIRRPAMVNLFASILRRDEDQHYYLVTPVEKVRIQVEDCPFIANQMEVNDSGRDQVIVFNTNIGESVTADKEHPIVVEVDEASEEPHPMVHVRCGLHALITRAVFYRLVDLCEEKSSNSDGLVGVWSSQQFFVFGSSPGTG